MGEGYMLDVLSERIGMLELTLSNICNSRCKMCDIGTERFSRRELSIDIITRIFNSEIAKRAEIISLCGGEPFLRKDFVDIVKRIRKRLGRRFNLNVSTNGLDTGKIIRDVGRIVDDVNLVLVFSLDGSERIHNLQRGLDNAFKRTMKTIDSVRKSFPEIEVNIHMTITPMNCGEILDVYNIAKSRGAFFRASFAHDTPYLTNFVNRHNTMFNFSEEQIKEIEEQMNILHKEYTTKRHFGDALFFNQMPKRMRDASHRFSRCFTSYNLVLVKEDGDVHICVMSPPVGNVNKNSLDEIFLSKEAEEIRRKAAEYKCPNCMMLCGSYFNYESIGRLFSLFFENNPVLLPKYSGRADKKEIVESSLVNKNNAASEISRPLPPCLFTIKERMAISRLRSPKGCADCREMFVVDNGVIKLCDGLKGIRIPDDLQEYFASLRKINKEKGCYSKCNPILRSKCQCLINEK